MHRIQNEMGRLTSRCAHQWKLTIFQTGSWVRVSGIRARDTVMYIIWVWILSLAGLWGQFFFCFLCVSESTQLKQLRSSVFYVYKYWMCVLLLRKKWEIFQQTTDINNNNNNNGKKSKSPMTFVYHTQHSQCVHIETVCACAYAVCMWVCVCVCVSGSGTRATVYFSFGASYIHSARVRQT